METADFSWNEVTSKRFNHPLLPRSIRGIIVGKAGCGKTTLLLNLLRRLGWLNYDNLCVFRKSLFQPEYRILNPFPNKPWFLRVCSTSLLKTLWEKEKLLVTSNFSFSHSVFYWFGKLSGNLKKFEIVVCIRIWKSLKFVVWERVKKAFDEHLLKECILRLFKMRDEIQNSQMPPLLVI